MHDLVVEVHEHAILASSAVRPVRPEFNHARSSNTCHPANSGTNGDERRTSLPRRSRGHPATTSAQLGRKRSRSRWSDRGRHSCAVPRLVRFEEAVHILNALPWRSRSPRALSTGPEDQGSPLVRTTGKAFVATLFSGGFVAENGTPSQISARRVSPFAKIATFQGRRASRNLLSSAIPIRKGANPQRGFYAPNPPARGFLAVEALEMRHRCQLQVLESGTQHSFEDMNAFVPRLKSSGVPSPA